MPIIAAITSAKIRKPDQDRQRHADEIDLHLRHQPRQHAEPELNNRPNTRNGAASCMPILKAAAKARVASAATSPLHGISPGANSV